MLIANAVRVVGEDTKLWARHADCKIGNTPSSKGRLRMIEFVVEMPANWYQDQIKFF